MPFVPEGKSWRTMREARGVSTQELFAVANSSCAFRKARREKRTIADKQVHTRESSDSNLHPAHALLAIAALQTASGIA